MIINWTTQGMVPINKFLISLKLLMSMSILCFTGSFVTQSYGQIVRLCMRFFRPYPIRVSVIFYLDRLGCLCQTCSFLFSFACSGLSFYNDCTRSYVAFPHTGFCIKINKTYWIFRGICPLAAGVVLKHCAIYLT